VVFNSLGYEPLAVSFSSLPKDSIFLIQKAEKLEDVFLTDQTIKFEKILKKVNENYSSNYSEEQKLLVNFQLKSYVENLKFEINFKKSVIIPKNKQEDFKKEVNKFIETTRNSITELENSFSYEISGRKIKLLSQPTEPEQKNNTPIVIIQKFSTLLEKYLDEKEYTIKTGLFTIDKEITFNQPNKSQDPKKTYGNIQGIFNTSENRFSIKNFDFISDFNAYDYMLKNVISVDNSLIYQIAFQPKKNRGKYEGELYVDTEDYGVVKANYHLAKGEKLFGVNMKFLLGVKVKDHISSGSFIFKKGRTANYEPLFFEETKGNYYDFDRNLLLKENTEGWFTSSDKMKFRLKLIQEEVQKYFYTFEY